MRSFESLVASSDPYAMTEYHATKEPSAHRRAREELVNKQIRDGAILRYIGCYLRAAPPRHRPRNCRPGL